MRATARPHCRRCVSIAYRNNNLVGWHYEFMDIVFQIVVVALMHEEGNYGGIHEFDGSRIMALLKNCQVEIDAGIVQPSSV